MWPGRPRLGALQAQRRAAVPQVVQRAYDLDAHPLPPPDSKKHPGLEARRRPTRGMLSSAHAWKGAAMVQLAQCVSGPAGFVVTLVVGLLLVAGALVLGGTSRKRRRARRDHTCRKCGHANAANARFCAQCGDSLQETTS